MGSEIDVAIENLSKTIEVLDKACNDEKIYNTYLGSMLEQMSYEMLRSANELKEMRYMYC